ncbi:polymorphic toxin-type HINT domain-containing protein [Streptomyces sp. NPDC102467]|uniref:polymorphic toxin-type HINT domain-containing protein n=1 Tax=Streptomyces sp. NPDC102467 TaxID=3366179 RepID=UPI0037F2994F
MRLDRSLSGRAKRRLVRLAPALTSVTALALMAGLGAQPGALPPKQDDRTGKVSQDWNEDTAAEQLRQDQCLMNGVLQLGGTSMAAVAQDALNQPADQLHVLANPDYWDDTPLNKAYEADKAVARKAMDDFDTLKAGWQAKLDGLDAPGGFTDAGFHWPPGSGGDGKQDFYDQTGLGQWVSDTFSKNESDFYEDPTPLADTATKNAVTTLGAPLYGGDTGGVSPAYERHEAYDYLTNWSLEPTGADNARVFLESGGFPTSAPQPDSAEFRIAVENLKTRFAACAWRDPIDPDGVLSEEENASAAEWQQEITSQVTQRNQILNANTTAAKALVSGSKILGNMLGNSWVADHVVRWQAWWAPGGGGKDDAFPPDAAQFTKAKNGLAQAQSVTKAQLILLKQQAAAAKRAVTASDTAVEEANAIADANGAPRGRGLLVAQQKAQVTHGIAAALDAMVIAGQTTEAATHASAADSATIAQRAIAQAAQSKAEFRKESAQYAELQAKWSAASAKQHRDNAKKDKENAEAALQEALTAEGDAKAAAEDAHKKRLAAESEEKTAKAEKETAAAKQAEAAQHRKDAEGYNTTAQDAKKKAETAAGTASARRHDAETARDDAKDKRDDAWDAEQKADAARAKADAKDAYADSLDAGDAATAARTAADEADRQATTAETAAKNARASADAATQAAADADAAATRAEAAAGRARADSDAAQADKATADAAVRVATSAAADAIAASKHAAAEAALAVKDAAEAEKHAKEARTQADEALKQSVIARVAAAKAAGFAYTTAQAAVDARQSAARVADPANDAIQLGSPYVTKDSAAGLVVLAGQGSKTIAEQQAAVADAHAANATKEAALAKSLADKASADAKAALQAAAGAAGYAAEAQGYAKEALGYSAAAALAASKATQSLTRTIEYDRQATADAAAADAAAGRAEGYAKDARDSADEAALDAEAARNAASAAEAAAKDARTAADQADADATAAEEAAKDADKYAKEAQEASDRTEREEANQASSTGVGTGIPGVFAVPDESTVKIVSSKQIGTCPGMPDAAFLGCDAMYDLVVTYEADFYLCADGQAQATADGCPKAAWQFLKRATLKKVTIEGWTHHFSGKDIVRAGWQSLFGDIPGTILFAFFAEDLMDCWHGDKSACAWSLATLIPLDAPLAAIADAVKAVNISMRTGTGVTEALALLRTLDIDAAALAGIEREAQLTEALRVGCRANSFPGSTQVLMADGSHRPISQLGVGDRVRSMNPASGQVRSQQVTDTFKHDTQRLVDITVADGGRLSSTAGHRFYVVDRGWTLVSDLRVGDRLRTPDGSVRPVTALLDRSGLSPRTVYDLTVSDLHTFFVLAGTTPVLVHNCKVALGWFNANFDEWAKLPDNKFFTLEGVDARNFAAMVRKIVADPGVVLHVNMTGLIEKGGFMKAAKRGLLAGEDGFATDYEMSLIARAVANGQRPWESVKFYSPSGGAMRLDPPTKMPDLSELGKLDPVRGGVNPWCGC